jgi:hypothetical protein
MLTLVHSIVSVLACRFRSRAVLELEIVALRHQLNVLRRSVRADRSFALGLALPIMAALSGSDGVGQAGNGDPLAPSRISAR